MGIPWRRYAWLPVLIYAKAQHYAIGYISLFGLCGRVGYGCGYREGELNGENQGWGQRAKLKSRIFHAVAFGRGGQGANKRPEKWKPVL
jgi:hypothetical protein